MPRAKHYQDVHLDMAIKLVEEEGFGAAKAGRHVAKVAGLKKPIPGGSIRSAMKRRRDGATPVATPSQEPEPVATPPDPIPPRRCEMVAPDAALSDPRLTGERLQAAIVLARGGTQQEAAEAIGRSQSTISAWMQDPVMRTVVGDLRSQVHRALWEQGAQELLANAVKGIGALGRSTDFLDRVIARAADAVDEELDFEADTREREAQARAQDDSIRRGLEAARALPTTVRPMMDAGGFPKTERVEHSAGGAAGPSRTPEEVDAEIKALDSEIEELAEEERRIQAAMERGDVLDASFEETA